MAIGRLKRAAELGAHTYTHAGVNQFAAAISYRVLFSLVPFVALVIAIIDFFLPESVETSVVVWIGEQLAPTGQDGAAAAVTLERSAPPASLAGAISLVALLWSAGGMMAALRAAFAAVFGGGAQRPYLRGKALDVALVLVAGLLLLAAFGLSILSQVVAQAVETVAGWLGGDGGSASTAASIVQTAGTAALTFVALAFLYRVVPANRPRLRDVAVGAAVATVGAILATDGFGLYLEHAAGFDDLYGPLGTVLAFLLLVYLLAMIVLAGACLAAAWPESAAPPPPAATGPDEPWRDRLVRMARGLVVVQPAVKPAPADPASVDPASLDPAPADPAPADPERPDCSGATR